MIRSDTFRTSPLDRLILRICLARSSPEMVSPTRRTRRRGDRRRKNKRCVRETPISQTHGELPPSVARSNTSQSQLNFDKLHGPVQRPICMTSELHSSKVNATPMGLKECERSVDVRKK